MMDRSRAVSASDTFPHPAREAESASDARGSDARSLQQALQERLFAEEEHPQEPAARMEVAEPASRWPYLWRGLKIAAGLAVIAVFGWLPLRAMLQTSSVEAVLNSRLVTLRAPIGGRIVAASDPIKDRARLDAGAVVLRVVNPRSDRARLDDLRRQKSRLENERPSLAAKLAT